MKLATILMLALVAHATIASAQTRQPESAPTAATTNAELLQWNRSHPVDPMIVALPYIGQGDNSQALVWLEKAYAQHSNELTTLKVSPVYDPLRADPRFQDLLRRVGLAN